ncbi:unnamed protein product [Mucor hiemalis]
MEKITLYYFTVGAKATTARGENVKLMLEDAGLDHEYIRVNRADGSYEEKRAQAVKEGLFSATLPYIEVGGKRFGKTVPIMRYISVKLGNKYHGSTDEENQLLDCIADITNDWFESLKNSFFGSEEQKIKQRDVTTPKYIDTFEKYYSVENGPYILGEKISYADFLVYHMIDDDSARDRLGDSPNLTKFVEAFEERPNIKKCVFYETCYFLNPSQNISPTVHREQGIRRVASFLVQDYLIQ